MNAYIYSLVLNAKSGSLKAFEQLYIKYKDKVYALALATLKSASEAKEVTRQAFIHAFENLGSLQDEKAFDVWIQYFALHESNAGHKDNIYAGERETYDKNAERIEDDFFVPQEYIERYDLSYRLRMIIDGLPKIRRQTLILSVYDRLSPAEIAQIMECSVKDVISRLRYTKGHIKTEIEKRERQTGEHFYQTTLIPFDSIYTYMIHSRVMSATAAADIWKEIREYILSADSRNIKPKKLSVGIKAAIAASIATIFICAGIVTALLTGSMFSARGADGRNVSETAPYSAATADSATAAIPGQESSSKLDSQLICKISGTYYVPKAAGNTTISLTVKADGSVTEQVSGKGTDPSENTTTAEIVSISKTDSTVCQFETTPDFTFYNADGSYTDSINATYYAADTPMKDVPESVKAYLSGFSSIDLSGKTLGIPVIVTDKDTYYVGSSDDPNN